MRLFSIFGYYTDEPVCLAYPEASIPVKMMCVSEAE